MFNDEPNGHEDESEMPMLRRSTRNKQPNRLYTEFVQY